MNKKVIIGVVLSFLLLATIGFTYAFFIATVNGNENAKDQVVETGTLSLVYKDGPELKLDSAIPGSSVTKTFTVTNTGTLDATYTINLTKLINTITNEELVLEASCQSYKDYVDINNKGTLSGTCDVIEETPIIESEIETTSTVKEGISILPEITHEYTLKITFIETGDSQNYNQGKTFSALININESLENNSLYSRILRDNTAYADNVPSPNVASETGINFTTISSESNGKGLYYTTDPNITEDGKRVYYYRGAVENNYVVFGEYNTDKIRHYNSSTSLDYETNEACIAADSTGTCSEYVYHKTGDKMCWRIVRTNEDGSIKLRYGGATDENGHCPQTGSDVKIGISAYNINNDVQYYDNAYVGYMYGETGLTSNDENPYERTHTNINNSTVKAVIDNWYKDNIANTNYHSIVANTIYCNDRSVVSPNDMPTLTVTTTTYINSGKGFGAGKDNTTFYRAMKSYINSISSSNNNLIANSKHEPTLRCLNNNDKFTLSVTSEGTDEYGNNDLIYPTGLLTVDEVVLAGGSVGQAESHSLNKDYYLYNHTAYWTMTPMFFTGFYVYISIVGGVLNDNSVNLVGANAPSCAVLPAISLIPDANVSTGTGTYNDPYIIDTNE